MTNNQKDAPGLSETHGLICESLGKASMCWSETPSGVFETSRCLDIANTLNSHIESRLEQARKEGFEAALDTCIVCKELEPSQKVKLYTDYQKSREEK